MDKRSPGFGRGWGHCYVGDVPPSLGSLLKVSQEGHFLVEEEKKGHLLPWVVQGGGNHNLGLTHMG